MHAPLFRGDTRSRGATPVRALLAIEPKCGVSAGDSALASFAVAEVASRAWVRTWSRASRNRLECFPRISAESKPRAIRGRTKVVTEPSSRNFSGTFRSCYKCYGRTGGRSAPSRTTLRSFWRPDPRAGEGWRRCRSSGRGREIRRRRERWRRRLHRGARATRSSLANLLRGAVGGPRSRDVRARPPSAPFSRRVRRARGGRNAT